MGINFLRDLTEPIFKPCIYHGYDAVYKWTLMIIGRYEKE